MLDGSDMAQCSVTAGLVAAGSPYTVSAEYSGDMNYATSTGTITQDVNRATATIGVTSSESSLVSGQSVSFTATITGITPPGTGTPMGSIVFSVVGSNGTIATCHGGDTVLLSGSSATCNFPKGLPASALSYTVSATLSDPNYKSPVAGTLVQAVQRAETETTVSKWPSSVVASAAFTFDVTIKTRRAGVESADRPVRVGDLPELRWTARARRRTGPRVGRTTSPLRPPRTCPRA